MSSARIRLDQAIAEFCAITSASAKDARRYMEKYKQLDVAVDAYYNDPRPAAPAGRAAGPSTTKITQLFEKYKAADETPADPAADMITFDGTQAFCEDIGVSPEDVVLLSLAYELKSVTLGEWPRKGWIDGCKALGVDSVDGFRAVLPRLRARLGSESDYFAKVYQHTFDFARAEGQRSLPIDSAKAFWELLLPTGLQGGALSHIARDDDGDQDMDGSDAGWKEEYNQWWFDFLDEKGGKGVSKDTWSMFMEFVRTIDSRFEKHDEEGAWPSSIDDFVEYAKERVAKGGK